MADSDPDAVHVETVGPSAGPDDATAPPLETHAAQVNDAYLSLMADSVDPVLITSLDGVILAANPAAGQLADLTSDALVGEPLGSERLPANLRALHKAVPAARQNPELQQSLDARMGNGNVSYELRTRHLTFKGRTAIQWVVHDQTAQQEIERARDEQIYMIVHDLRNPLGNIISSLELLKESLNDPDVTPAPNALVNIALRSSRRISLLVESLMDMTRMEAGQFTLSTTTARLDVVVEHAIDFVKPTADRKHIPLTVDLELGLPPVLINVNMIERVVVNLLDNAIKFAMPGQAVYVYARRGQENEVEISVRDEGPGIPLEDQTRIFQKFSRGTSVSGQTPGTGLGLAFCKMAVEAHGGRISVDSRPGAGSTFTFTLQAEAG